MRREHSCHRHIGRLQVKESRTGHPLMELGHNLVRRLKIIFVETLYDPSGSIAEKRRLTVIPVACKGINPESCPEFGKNPVLHRKELLEIHKDCSRAARHVPSSDTDSQSLGSSMGSPGPVQCRIFYEIRIVLSIHPHVRTDHDVLPAELALKIERLRGNHGIYASHLVADFPADLKQIIRLYKFCFHSFNNNSLSFPGRSLWARFRPGRLYKTPAWPNDHAGRFISSLSLMQQASLSWTLPVSLRLHLTLRLPKTWPLQYRKSSLPEPWLLRVQS